MRRWLVVTAVVAAVVLTVVLGRGSTPPPAGAAPLSASTSLEPGSTRYGDPVVAEVDVAYDPQTVDAAGIRVQPDFTPYVATAAPSVRLTADGRTAVASFRYTLLCVTEGCLPTGTRRRVTFEPVRVTGTAAGQSVTASATWPSLAVTSRLTPADLSGSIRFRHPSTLTPPAYAVAPGLLAGLLIAAAALLALAAAALVVPALRRRRREAAARAVTPLDLALAYARDAAGRPDPQDRRRALELLAEAVAAGGEPGLARDAADTAWSEPPPTPAGTVELADRVEDRRQART